MQPSSRQVWLFSLAGASGLLQTAIFPNLDIYWLSWIALVPLIYALLAEPDVEIILAGRPSHRSSLTVRQAFSLGYCSGIIWYAGTCYWVYGVMNLYGGLSAPVSAGILVLFCLYLGLYHGLFAVALVRINRRSSRFALLSVPFLWVAVELARARVTGFPWDLLGTTQVNNSMFSPVIATRAGVYGISFLIAVINVAIAAALLSRTRRSIIIAVVCILLACGFSAGEFLPKAFPATTHTAVLVQQNLPLDIPWTAETFDVTLAKLADISRQAAKKDDPAPRLIIWPESPGPFFLVDPKFQTWMSTLAVDRDAYIIVGSLGTRGDTQSHDYETFNSAALISPSGAFLLRYDKVHLVPFGEYVPFRALFFFAKNLTKEVGTFTPGSERKVFQTSQSGTEGKIGTFICYESIFPDEIREFAANGAQVFVNLSNDGWFGSTGAVRQHLNMARMRAIENHRWLLRATNTGITAVIDPNGRIMSDLPRNKQTTLRASYMFLSDTTFYTRHGDWFAYLCAIISLAAIFVRFSFQAGVLR